MPNVFKLRYINFFLIGLFLILVFPGNSFAQGASQQGRVTSGYYFTPGQPVVITGTCPTVYFGAGTGIWVDRTPPVIDNTRSDFFANYSALVSGKDAYTTCSPESSPGGNFSLNLGVKSEGSHTYSIFFVNRFGNGGEVNIDIITYLRGSFFVGVAASPTQYTGSLALGDRVEISGSSYFYNTPSLSDLGPYAGVTTVGNIVEGPTRSVDQYSNVIWFFRVNLDDGRSLWIWSRTFYPSNSSYLDNSNIRKISSAPAPSISNFSVSPATIVAGESTTLSWSSTNTTSCSANWTSSTSPSGSVVVSPTANTTYTITCTGAGGTVDRSVSVNVTQPSATLNFSANPSTITAGQTTVLSWTSTLTSSCRSTGAGPLLSGGQADADNANNNYWVYGANRATSGSITTPPLNNSLRYYLVCNANDGTVRQANVLVTVEPSAQTSTSQTTQTTPAPTLTFSATPTSVESGQSSNLTWAVTNATNCTAGGAWSGSKNGSGGNESTGSLTASRTYTLSCSGGGGTTQTQSVTVNVNAPVVQAPVPNVSISADDTTLTSGSGTTVRWSATNATSCTRTGGSGSWAATNQATSGTFNTGNLTSSQTYNITCTGNGGTSPQGLVTVTVNAPQSCTSAANACGGTNTGTIVNGVCSATVPANPTGFGQACNSPANSCGMVNPGTRRCDGSCSAATAPPNSSCPIPPTVTLDASATTITSGSGTTITWSSTNATSCTRTGGSGSWAATNQATSGTFNTGNLTSSQTYNITCTGSGGTSPGVVTVTVTQPQAVTPAPTVTLDASQTTITSGNSTTLTWSSTNATSCSANWTTSNASSGTRSVSPTSNTTYSITCTGAGGPATQSVAVAVTQPVTTTSTTNESCQSAANTCSIRGSGFVVNGICNAVVPPNPTNFGQSCESAPNSCGQRAGGTIMCNGSCSANIPSNSICAASAISDNVRAPTLTLTTADTSTRGATSVELRWTATNADRCEASGDWGGTKGISGTHQTGNLNSSKRYSLVCVGQGGSISRSVNVTVNNTTATTTSSSSNTNTSAGSSGNTSTPSLSSGPLSPTMIFVADRTNIPNQAKFSWSSTNATKCEASGAWTGSRSPSGSTAIVVNKNSRFTLTCSGPGGEASRTLQIEVEASPTPTTSTGGGTVTSNPNVTPGKMESPKVTPRAPVPIPLTTSVVREEDNGEVSKVSSGRTAQVSPPIISMVATPIVAFNSIADIDWSVANATKCEASGSWVGEKDVNGSEVTPPLQEDSEFKLSCEGNGGEASRTVTIVVSKEESKPSKVITNFINNFITRITNIFNFGD